MKKIIFIILLIFICLAILPSSALASQFGQGLNNVATASGFAQITIEQYAAGIVQTLLTLVGVIFVILLIYGGFLYMSSQGEKEKVKKGKDAIIAAVIGLIIIGSGYSITYFIATQVQNPGTVQGGFNGTCEVSGDPNYRSLGCCEYRYSTYGSKDCCDQSDFCNAHHTFCIPAEQACP